MVEQAQLDDLSRWFEKTAVVDACGLPLVVYRGQHGATEDGSIQTLLGSATFCADPGVASTYAQQPNNRDVRPQAPFVVPAFLHISNPLFVQDNDPFVDASHLIAKLGTALTETFIRKHAAHVQHTNFWDWAISPLFKNVDDFLNEHPDRLKELYLKAYVLLDDNSFVEAMKAAGYDGAIHIGSGVSMNTLEYRVFDAGQVKPVFEWAARVQNYTDGLAEVQEAPLEQQAAHG